VVLGGAGAAAFFVLKKDPPPEPVPKTHTPVTIQWP